MRPRPVLVCAAAMTLALATIAAAQSPPAPSPTMPADAITPLTIDQLAPSWRLGIAATGRRPSWRTRPCSGTPIRVPPAASP
jgi:hypothetical protein